MLHDCGRTPRAIGWQGGAPGGVGPGGAGRSLGARLELKLDFGMGGLPGPQVQVNGHPLRLNCVRAHKPELELVSHLLDHEVPPPPQEVDQPG